MSVAIIWCVLFLLYGFVIAAVDFRSRRVPNGVLVVGVVLQIVWLGILRQIGARVSVGAGGWDQALIGFVVGLALFYPLWRFRALGAGDVKFIAVLGFLLGPTGLFPVLLLGTLVCGVHGLGMVLLMGWTPARNVWRLDSAVRRGVPYAAYLALAAIAWMIWKVSEEGLRIAWGG